MSIPEGSKINAFVGTRHKSPNLSLMPKYFFHVVFHDGAHFDLEGEELPDKHAAWKEATVTTGQMIQSLDGNLQPGNEWRMDVTDEFANPLYSIHVSTKHSH